MNTNMLIISIAIIGALLVLWLMRQPVMTEDDRYWQENDYWSDRDEIEDEGLVDHFVDRATSAAAYDEAIRRVGTQSDLLTATYFNVLKEWGY